MITNPDKPMRNLAICGMLLLTAHPVAAQNAQLTVLGSGQSSCATWSTGNNAQDFQSVGWILGYWSGANRFGSTPNNGDSVDVAGIVERVRLECKQRPDWILYHVVGLVYDEYARENR